jgi:hypothetical protein
MADPAYDELHARARDSLRKLRGLCEAEDVGEAKRLVEEMRNVRAYEEMGLLAEAVSRRDPSDAKNRRLYAQYLIDTGKPTAAIDLLRPLVARLPEDDPEFAEATGLIGRAYKQIFFDAGDKADPAAQDALRHAVAAYREPYEADPDRNTWHGVNLLALLTRARRLGLHVASDLKAKQVAEKVVAALDATPQKDRNEWYLPTLAEASLGSDDWNAVEQHVRAYAKGPEAKAFQIASTLRQFTEIWDLEAVDERGRGLVAILRARLLQLPGGAFEVDREELHRLRRQSDPAPGQLEAVLGDQGFQTFRWWKTGLDRALAVVAVRQKLGQRVGTGFLVEAASLGLEPPDELLVLTNFHVVNKDGVSPGVRPGDAEILFEAIDAERAHTVQAIVWSSPPDRHDASVLRLQQPVAGIEPLPLATTLPVLENNARVYVIGHPGGRDLAFSFQDNELLDHEGPPSGRPQIQGVARVHYRAPTEGGSSGSPVFNSKLWQVIALHHKGGRTGMAKLNGQEGSYAANEGISIGSIKEAIREQPGPSK